MRQSLTLAILTLLIYHSGATAQTKHIAAGYSAISATQIGFYIAKDAKLFEKHGLYVDPVYVAGGSRMAQAIIAGEFALALAGGNIVNVNLSGGDIVIIGGVVNVPSFYLFAQPSVKKYEDLKGKALGITRYGASTDVSLRAYLKKYSLEPDRDVKILQMGGQPEIVAGMQAGVVQGGILTSPADFRAKKAGFVMLANFAKEGIDYPTTSLVSTRSTIKKDRETVKRFLMAYSEAVDRLFRDKELAIKVLGKWTRTQDRDTLESSYEYATNFIERPPRLPFKATENIVASMAESDPRAKDHKAEEFLDPSIYNELEKAGFFKSLGR
ncbi:MAG TPA: ABC transporter substrate-binding protein [Terriglobales bacterium]|jgi:NitT/TauT family transport system substrate-binding protein|nr:ABC transporter substrate-binding protein [Terriglobales bacterium]